MEGAHPLIADRPSSPPASPAASQPTPGLRYRGPWRLPGPGFHRLAVESLSLGYVIFAPLRSWRPSCWRTWIEGWWALQARFQGSDPRGIQKSMKCRPAAPTRLLPLSRRPARVDGDVAEDLRPVAQPRRPQQLRAPDRLRIIGNISFKLFIHLVGFIRSEGEDAAATSTPTRTGRGRRSISSCIRRGVSRADHCVGGRVRRGQAGSR